MNKNNIIIYSAIIIIIFALLYHLEHPGANPKSEVSPFLKSYEGEKGIAVLKVPDFLLGEVIKNESLELNKKSFKSFRIMILHENENQNRTCDATNKQLREFLDSLKFQSVIEAYESDSTQMSIFNKNVIDPWRENVTIYTSDSTLFLFNFISDIDDEQVKKFSQHLSNQNLF